MITAQEELERFWDRKAQIFGDAFYAIAEARVRGWDYRDLFANFQSLLRNTLILSNLYGRKRMLMEADELRRNARFSGDSAITSTTFEEAVEALVSREPRLEQSAIELSRLYNNERVFGMAFSIDQKLTERVQETLARVMREGGGVSTAEKILEDIVPFTKSYATNVYRTNLATSYNEGRKKQAQDPAVAEVIPALQFRSMDDARVRPNHAAADGLVAATDDPVWRRFTPPIGHQCRCAIEFVSLWELEQRGLIRNGKVVSYYPPGWAGAHPDPNFKVGAV